jgi:predicted alpha/beta-hydrolase family hydrolase
VGFDRSDLLVDGPARAKTLLILAHGAGAPMDSPFMETIAAGVARGGVRVARFEFPYMAARRGGGKRPPDREPVLRQRWEEVVASLRPEAERVFIGGKSMGGRIASMVADSVSVNGLVCLGYPFHPPGKPERTRTAHLAELRTAALFVQGTRDALGSREDVGGYALSRAIQFAWLEDGDHSFKPRKSSGRTEEQNLREAIDAIAGFLS